jgi:hypothetical protein
MKFINFFAIFYGSFLLYWIRIRIHNTGQNKEEIILEETEGDGSHTRLITLCVHCHHKSTSRTTRERAFSFLFLYICSTNWHSNIICKDGFMYNSRYLGQRLRKYIFYTVQDTDKNKGKESSSSERPGAVI